MKLKKIIAIIPFLILSYHQIYGQNDSLEIELHWNNHEIDFLLGMVVIGDSNGAYCGISYDGKLVDENQKGFFAFKIPIPENKNKSELRISTNLLPFYDEKIYITASDKLEKVAIFLQEIPYCEFKEVISSEKKKKPKRLKRKEKKEKLKT